jgi:hypothetical protein
MTASPEVHESGSQARRQRSFEDMSRARRPTSCGPGFAIVILARLFGVVLGLTVKGTMKDAALLVFCFEV